ncbi:hypothetical protein ABEB36_001560 [Hypothenemus hampei]|uniref:Disease resistance R13L4/SHOC-2-like LRR domain-containing protein n=1 Tax=Hypothenemus hampei TaxID=57062 RepID=A0ABD1FF13_HYPHA
MIVPSMNCDIICAMFRRKKSVNKKLLEHKLYLARENPEPIFDLADCDLTDVPMGIYSLCKVFLKQSLILTNNQITSLSGGGDLKDLNKLRILNISFNDFHSLPEEISIFEQLEELYVDNNHLKSLPDSLCHLVNLKILSCTNNKLKSLPEGIGLLIKLEELNLRVNPQLSRLPKSICKAASLALLSVDSENFIYPPKDVIESGTEALLKFISEDVGFDYSPPVRDTEECTRTSPAEADQVQLKRVQDFLDFERNNKLIQEKEIEIANVHKENKKKLLESISQRQSNLDLELSKLHQVRELERFRLIEQLQEAENNADIAINNLLNLSKEPVSQLLEKEKEEETKLISALKRYNDKLKKDDILVAMENILKQEAEVFNKFHRDKTDSSRNIIEQEQETNTKLFHLFQQQDTQRANLIGKLMENNDLQKAAMGALLERGDARSWGLVQQVRLVESQLSVLTSKE